LFHKEKENLLPGNIKRKLFLLFRLNNRPVIRVYNGFGNSDKVIVLGHVLKLSAMPRVTYRQNWITNLFSILRLFIVKPWCDAKISLEWEGTRYFGKSEKDGFFRFEIFPLSPPKEGWQPVFVQLEEPGLAIPVIGKGKVFIPFPSSYGFISDIDDTFLVSYSSRMRRRLYELFTKNARSRKPFAGVVNHYQLLACSGQLGRYTNPFFYVSSSEWNLYDFIVEFSRANHLPPGAFLLNQMKRLHEFWRSGQSKHGGKFTRIVRVVEAYPHLQFVLCGDDSQKDPEIYQSVVAHFPGKILAVYIRRIHEANSEKVQAIIEDMESKGVTCCYFKHSAEAVIHSQNIGLILK
jgi:phosphatidate phosphatase APP1